MTLRKSVLAGLFLFVLLSIGALFPLLSQGETIITIAVPSWMSDVFTSALFEDFEAENPGVKVIVVPTEETYFSSPAFELDTHLDGVQGYAQSADVLYLQSGAISPEATRAGYLLDLSPLIESDAAFDIGDFYPAMLESFQWDRGTWAIPLSGSASMFIYDRLAFDAAGVPYPNENWTFEDIASAARALTQYDENGDISVPGMALYDPAMMFYVFTGNTFYDPTQLPSPPMLNTPEVAAFMEEWQALSDDIMPESGGNFFNEIPFAIEQAWRLSNASFTQETQERDWQGALLPGGSAGIYTTGLGISAGTENPEMAFALVDYLTRDPVVIERIFADAPARRSMVGVEPEESNFFGGSELPEEALALIDTAIEVAIPTSELRYSQYLFTAMQVAEADGLDMASALEEAQAVAEENLSIADARRDNVQVFVATPVPTPIVGADQTVINFGLNAFSSEVPNRELWDDVIDEFLATHPRIGNIDIVPPNFGPNGPDITEYDCYFTQNNQIAFPQFETTDLLNLDPFMDTDPAFDPADFFGGALEQVQRDGMTWAYPVVMQPEILWYDTEKFADAGLPEPEGGWTIDAFVDALQTLDFVSDEDEPIFQPTSFGSSYLLMLAAAFGGIPYDYRIDPPALNLTDQASINALRQALDLARDGLMDFQRINANGGGGGGFFGGEEAFAVTTDSFNTFSFRLQNRNEENSFVADWRLTNYPNGNQYTPVAFSLGVAYINNTAQDPQACYEWITTISEHAELFTGVPTRRSLINDPGIAQSQGEDIAAMYRSFADLLESPNVVNFPGQFGGGSSADGAWLETNWLIEIFNGYILDGADLETVMAETQTNIEMYRECISDIPPFEFDEDNPPEDGLAYTRQFTDCAVAISPEMRENFSWIYDQQD
ncbi:MAG: extracellular solute-binding protein [Aggregatilineales bacterium]